MPHLTVMSLADLLNFGKQTKFDVEEKIPESTIEPSLAHLDKSGGFDALTASLTAELNKQEELRLAQELVESQADVLKEDAEARQAETEALKNKAIDDAMKRTKALAKCVASQRKAPDPFIGSLNSFTTGGAVEFPRGKWVGERTGPAVPLTTLDKVRQQAASRITDETGSWGKGGGWGDGWGDGAWGGCCGESSWGKGAWPAGGCCGWGESAWDACVGAGGGWGSSSSSAVNWKGCAPTGFGCGSKAGKGYGPYDSDAACKGGGMGGSFGCGGGAKGKGYDGYSDNKGNGSFAALW